MLRFCRPTLAKLIAQPEVSSDAVRQFHLTSRILGCRGMKEPNLVALDQIVTKTAGNAQGLAYATALIGRARSIVLYEKPEQALPDLEAALKSLEPQRASNKLAADLWFTAKALHLRANNDILDRHEAAMSVAGAANEEQISSLRLAVKAQYAELRSLCPDCILVGLAEAEFALYQGRSDEAEAELAAIEKALLEASKTVPTGSGSSDLSSIAYRLTRESLVAPSASKYVESDSVSSILKTFASEQLKESAGASSTLTPQEIAELVIVLATAENKHHFHDFFPVHDHYKSHPSATAVAIEKEIRFFESPKSLSAVTSEQLKSVAEKNALPTARYSPAEVKKFLSTYTVQGKADGDLVSSLVEVFGLPTVLPGTALAGGLEAVAHQPASATESTDVHAQRQLIGQLFEQLLFRAQVARALSLEKLNRHHEAVKILDHVVEADSFIYMWRAYLARGRIRQHLGQVDEADKDFKKLFSVKKQYISADIPRRDEHRQKSAF